MTPSSDDEGVVVCSRRNSPRVPRSSHQLVVLKGIGREFNQFDGSWGTDGMTTDLFDSDIEYDSLTPDDVRELRHALQESWDVLSRHRSPLAAEARRDETREMLARKLLRCASKGETHPARLVTYALGSFV
jgi:hypothetical protein